MYNDVKNYDILNATLEWFQRAIPQPSSKNLHVQMGCHFEEVVEMVQAIQPLNGTTAVLLDNAEQALTKLADHLKKSENVVGVQPTEQVSLLDALCDQIVTATGVAHMMNFNLLGGMTEVNCSNWSKFVGGLPVFNEYGKIMKGPDYFTPDLTCFLEPEHRI